MPHQHTAGQPSEEPQPSQHTLLVLGLDPKLGVLHVLLRADMPERIAKRDAKHALTVAVHPRRWAAHALEVVGVDDADCLLVAEREVAVSQNAVVCFNFSFSRSCSAATWTLGAEAALEGCAMPLYSASLL